MTGGQAVVLLLDLAIILVLANLLGAAAKLLGQPPVVGEIIAGVLVGPTLFGGVIADTVFPANVRPLLSALASIGVVLFIGTTMSVTAFPVLARIIADRGMNRTRLGGLAVGSAAVADILAWSLLAVVMTLVNEDRWQLWRILF